MSLRDRTQQLLEAPGWPRVVLWAIAPVLCVALPGLGAMLAFAWIAVLFVFGRQRLALIGLRRPPRWLKLIALSLALAIAVQLLSGLAIEPVLRWITHQTPDTSKLKGIVGSWPNLMIFLALSWVVGALIEEVVFRGFIIGWGTLIFGEKFKWLLAVASSVIFGYSHLYQGAAGVILTGVVGFVLATAYIASRKNLPFTMLTHGFIDTISMIALFMGLLSA
jgi:membrane protease YdiL (CAAX protease family)